MSAEEILTNPATAKLFEKFNLFTALFRVLGWKILCGIHWLAEQAFSLFASAYKVLTFSSDPSSESLLAKFDVRNNTVEVGFLFALLTVVLVGIGIAIILGNDHIKGSVVIRNVLIGVLFIVLLPWLISQLNAAFIGTSVEDTLSDSSGMESFRESVVDLTYVFDERKGNGDMTGEMNEFSGDNWMDNIDILEVIRGSEYETDIDNVFNSMLENGSVVESKNKGELPFGIYIPFFATDYYYRYHFDFLALALMDGSLIVVMAFSFFKVVRISYEIIIHQLFAEVLAVTDISSGAKFKEVLKSLFSSYIILLYVPTAIQLFSQFQLWVNSTDVFSDDVGLLRPLLVLVVAFAVVDGPNLIERIFGIDAGIKSGFHTLMGLAHGARAFGHLASTPFRAAGAGLHAAGMPTPKDVAGALSSSRASDAANAIRHSGQRSSAPSSGWQNSQGGSANGPASGGGQGPRNGPGTPHQNRNSPTGASGRASGPSSGTGANINNAGNGPNVGNGSFERPQASGGGNPANSSGNGSVQRASALSHGAESGTGSGAGNDRLNISGGPSDSGDNISSPAKEISSGEVSRESSGNPSVSGSGNRPSAAGTSGSKQGASPRSVEGAAPSGATPASGPSANTPVGGAAGTPAASIQGTTPRSVEGAAPSGAAPIAGPSANAPAVGAAGTPAASIQGATPRSVEGAAPSGAAPIAGSSVNAPVGGAAGTPAASIQSAAPTTVSGVAPSGAISNIAPASPVPSAIPSAPIQQGNVPISRSAVSPTTFIASGPDSYMPNPDGALEERGTVSDTQKEIIHRAEDHSSETPSSRQGRKKKKRR